MEIGESSRPGPGARRINGLWMALAMVLVLNGSACMRETSGGSPQQEGSPAQEPAATSPAQAAAQVEEPPDYEMPAPRVVFKGRKRLRDAYSQELRFFFSVENDRDYPEFLFVPSPQLPPIGLNKKASRTIVSIREAGADRDLNTFITFKDSEILKRLYFGIRIGKVPPKRVYVALQDRKLNKEYRSNVVEIPESGSEMP